MESKSKENRCPPVESKEIKEKPRRCFFISIITVEICQDEQTGWAKQRKNPLLQLHHKIKNNKLHNEINVSVLYK